MGIYLCRFRGLPLFPSALGGLADQALFDRAGADPNVAHFAIHNGLNPLQVRQKAPFGDRSHMRADATFFLGFTTAPNVAALDRAFSSQFTNSSHNVLKRTETIQAIPLDSRGIMENWF